MIEPADIRAAVSAGLLTEAQAASLTQLAHARAGARRDLPAGEEPFELFRGFNEIFVVVGLVILTMGWIGTAGVIIAKNPDHIETLPLILGGIAAAVIWALAEYFTRARRMVAPSIALSILFAANAVASLSAAMAEPFMVWRGDLSSLPLPVAAATGAMSVFWVRFRVPFGLALIALGAFAVAILAAAGTSAGWTESGDPLGLLFRLSADGPFAWITLGLGVLVFAAAMAFDMSDPHRVTRRAANGFWLHVIAAPALVNTIALSLLERGDRGSDLLLMLVLAVFAAVAIVIDRRSFLIAAAGYIVALSSALFEGSGIVFAILALGVALLILGAFWERIRALLVRMIPGLPLDRLPPVYRKERLT